MKHTFVLFTIVLVVLVASCENNGCKNDNTQDRKDSETAQMQQAQYAKAQPVPVFDWSLERQLVIELYKVRNQKANTHSVWRSDFGTVEGDCPSYGYGIPYDTSLTNPLAATDIDNQGEVNGDSLATIEQPEPNGIFASKNTAATWVLCLGESGSLEPVYVETKVTVYPGPVMVNYETNQVTRSGAANVLIKK